MKAKMQGYLHVKCQQNWITRCLTMFKAVVTWKTLQRFCCSLYLSPIAIIINALRHITPNPSSSTPWQCYKQDPFDLWPHVLVQDPPRLQFRVEAPGPSAHCWALSLYFSFVFLFLFAAFSLLFVLSRKLLCFWFLLYHLYSKNFAFFYPVASQTCNNFSTISTRRFYCNNISNLYRFLLLHCPRKLALRLSTPRPLSAFSLSSLA